MCSLGVLPPSASWLWGDPAPQSPCPLACLQMGQQWWGWAMCPWHINQKALLVRVSGSMLCLYVYPNALEDYLCCLGLLICRSGWVMLEGFGLFWSSFMVPLWCWQLNCWNLSGESSFDLLTACKQAYLVVLTVNVIVIFSAFMMFWIYDFF